MTPRFRLAHVSVLERKNKVEGIRFRVVCFDEKTGRNVKLEWVRDHNAEMSQGAIVPYVEQFLTEPLNLEEIAQAHATNAYNKELRSQLMKHPKSSLTVPDDVAIPKPVTRASQLIDQLAEVISEETEPLKEREVDVESEVLDGSAA